MDYEVLVIRNLAFQMPLNPESKARVLLFIKSLAVDPETKADFVELGDEGEPLYTKVIDDTAVSYWVDGGAFEVTVNSIRDADS